MIKISKNISWLKCQGSVWCYLDSVNITHKHFDKLEGIYLIWHGGKNARVVKIGQGLIRNKIKKFRTDSEVLKYKKFNLYVTWAKVEREQRWNIEVFMCIL